jgi:hypothetical protein
MRETCGIEKVYVACRILGAETYSAPKEEEAKARATSQAFQVVFESLGHAMWLTICQKKKGPGLGLAMEISPRFRLFLPMKQRAQVPGWPKLSARFDGHGTLNFSISISISILTVAEHNTHCAAEIRQLSE